ncbi:MAG: hypothetical protein DRO05_06440 [Thermoproteota archaeon]|nr:MAG: hypothetical protein DRO05_06440 [Candidatus Korarchaeota archaeon]
MNERPKFKLFATESFLKDLERVPKEVKRRIKQRIQEIREDPFREERVREYKNVFKTRIGDYRLAYRVEEDSIILIIVEKRGKIYEELKRRLKGH